MTLPHPHCTRKRRQPAQAGERPIEGANQRNDQASTSSHQPPFMPRLTQPEASSQSGDPNALSWNGLGSSLISSDRRTRASTSRGDRLLSVPGSSTRQPLMLPTAASASDSVG